MAKLDKRERKKRIIMEYLPKCNSVYNCYIYGNIPTYMIDNACSAYAGRVNYEDVFGLIDETVFGSGKKGMLFTENGFYWDRDKNLIKYDIEFTNLNSGYNITLINEMIKKLSEIEDEPTGWEIAGSILEAAFDIFQNLNSEAPNSNSDNVVCNEEKNTVEEKHDNIEVKTIEQKNNLASAKELLDYVKKIGVAVNRCMECSETEINESLKEVIDYFQEDNMHNPTYSRQIEMLLSQEQYVELYVKPIDMVVATDKCQKNIKFYFSDMSGNISMDELKEDIESCQKVLQEYQEIIRQVRGDLKKINAFIN